MPNEMSPARLRSTARQVKVRDRSSVTDDQRLAAMLPKRDRRDVLVVRENKRRARHLFAIEAMHRAAQVAVNTPASAA